MLGRMHSIQSFSTLDGPGIRFVLFLQGCPLRCACCHNPDTWDAAGGTEIDDAQAFARILRCRDYFGEEGGVTVSGGEPLLQSGFVRALFARCREAGIHTALDTSGCILTDEALSVLDVTDLCLLDHKMPTDEMYRRYVGCPLAGPERFLSELSARGIDTWLRRVVIPTVTDGAEGLLALKALAERTPCVKRVELLPFRKLCQQKYDALGVPFPFGHLPECGAVPTL